MRELCDFIGGERVPAERLEAITLLSPNTGEPLGAMLETSPAHLERALSVAARAHERGSLESLEERALWLRRIARALESRRARLAEVEAAATGIVRRTTEVLASLTPVIFEKAAALMREVSNELPGKLGPVEVRRRGFGPALCLAPWNAPAPIAAHKVASALAAGCPVLLKPSEWAPYGVQILAEAIAEADLPPGAFQLVHGRGDVGARLVSDPRVRVVSFTGGLAGGRAVARACAEDLKPVQLELGGNNPLIVLEDADLELAVPGIVTALTTLNGQWCRALGRLLIARSRADEVLERVEAALARLRLGDARLPETDMGPMIHRGHRAHLEAHVAALVARGGRARAPVRVPEGAGAFLSPTLVEGCRPEDTLEEMFGPVAAVHVFGDEVEALRLASAPPYGLAAYVFGEERRALELARRLECGSTQVNGVSMTALHPDAPRAAWKNSGLGAEGTRETFQFFSGTTLVGVAGRRSVCAS